MLILFVLYSNLLLVLNKPYRQLVLQVYQNKLITTATIIAAVEVW